MTSTLRIYLWLTVRPFSSIYHLRRRSNVDITAITIKILSTPSIIFRNCDHTFGNRATWPATFILLADCQHCHHLLGKKSITPCLASQPSLQQRSCYCVLVIFKPLIRSKNKTENYILKQNGLIELTLLKNMTSRDVKDATTYPQPKESRAPWDTNYATLILNTAVVIWNIPPPSATVRAVTLPAKPLGPGRVSTKTVLSYVLLRCHPMLVAHRTVWRVIMAWIVGTWSHHTYCC